MWIALFISIAMAKECSEWQIKSAVCWALCRRDGYDSGSYMPAKKSCACTLLKSFEAETESVIKISNAVDKPPVFHFNLSNGDLDQ